MNSESLEEDDVSASTEDRTERLAHLTTEHSKLLSVIGSDLSESSNAIDQANELDELANAE